MKTESRNRYGEKIVRTSIRLPVSLNERLDGEADARVVSKNLLILKAIEHYLANPPDGIHRLRATSTYDPPNWWERATGRWR